MMLRRTIMPEVSVTENARIVIAKTTAAKPVSAPRLATRIGDALNRAVAQRYAEQRLQVERTGFGGML